MDERHKEILMASVISDPLKNVKHKFSQYKLIIPDENFFDYELLKAALKRKHQFIIYFLLKLGCRVRNPNKVNSEETPLHLVMKINNANIIKKILLSGASIYDKNENGETPIYAAFKQGYHSAVKTVFNFYYLKNLFIQILSLNDFKEDPMNRDNIIHFHIACVMNNLDIVRQYLEFGFDINSPLSLDSVELSGLNPLHYAATKQYYQLFDCFVQHGADLSIKNGDGLTALHISYYSRVLRHRIENIFDYGNDTKFINSVDNNGLSHFHLCCITNNPKNVKIFIDKGVDVNSATSLSCSDYPGFTPLHFAVKYGCDNVVQLLLENGADCNIADKTGTTPLHLACQQNSPASISIIEMLLNYKACVYAADEKKSTPLHVAFYNLNCIETKVFDMFISKIPPKVNFSDSHGLSYFHILCTSNNKSLVEDLLKSGVMVDDHVKSGHFDGFTALHFAAFHNQINIVEILLNWNAQVNFKSSKLFTPLHLACESNIMKVKEMYNQYKCAKSNNMSTNLDLALNRENQLKIIKLLLLHGANVEIKDYRNATALLNTCRIYETFSHAYRPCPAEYGAFQCFIKENLTNEIHFRIKKIIEILLLNNANINTCTNRQQSILHIVEKNYFLHDSEEIVMFLITKGADVNATDDKGFTPLHDAIISKNKKMVQILLKYKANVNAKTKDSITPLELLCQYFCTDSSNDRDILCALLECGSDVNIRKSNGETLLQSAIKNHLMFLIEKLLYCGADINMEDLQGNVSVSSLLAWDNDLSDDLDHDFEWKDSVSYAIVFHIVFTHVQKLLALGYYVHEKVQQCCIELRQCYNNMALEKLYGLRNVDDIYDTCTEELNKMKSIKIDGYTSLYSILLKGKQELSKHVQNNTLIKILEDPNIDNNFPLYSYLLKMQFAKGLIRSDVLQSANAALSSAIGLNLPELCYDSVLQYLTNEEIANLKAAVPARTSFKRKMDNDSPNMELPEKLQKKE